MKSTPLDYAAWRGSLLGKVTERLEQQAVFDLAGPLAGLHLLDVGCGTGSYTLDAARRGAIANGVDRSRGAVLTAGATAAGSGLRAAFTRADAAALPFRARTFDVVLAITVLCFVEDPEQAVSEMARVLRPGGHLVLGDLGRWSTWAAWRRARGWAGNETWRGARFRSLGELQGLARSAGLVPVNWRAAVFFPPVGALARAMEPVDLALGTRTSLGAAFVAVASQAR